MTLLIAIVRTSVATQSWFQFSAHSRLHVMRTQRRPNDAGTFVELRLCSALRNFWVDV